MNIYFIVASLTFIGLTLYYNIRDQEYLKTFEDYFYMFIEIVVESALWIICVPILNK